jgi:hypothetical protein
MTGLIVRRFLLGGAFVVLAGCRAESGGGLPPPTGSGSAPAPVIP